jgi:hypothetical protein
MHFRFSIFQHFEVLEGPLAAFLWLGLGNLDMTEAKSCRH